MYNLQFKSTTNRYTKEELFENIKVVWDFKKLQPTINDLSVFPSTICFTTYFNRFGSWKNALSEFAEFYNNGEVVISSPNQTRKVRKNLNNSTRYEIMKRDNFKCCICGKSPATNTLTILEVDHILPVTKGGDNSFDNLQTLCKDCNIGKLNKLFC